MLCIINLCERIVGVRCGQNCPATYLRKVGYDVKDVVVSASSFSMIVSYTLTTFKLIIIIESNKYAHFH